MQPGTPNYFYLKIIGMGFEMEEILEKIEVRLDPQESFAEMDKDGNMKNRIGGQVMYLNPPMMKKASEEIGNRKTEAPKNIRKENNRFVFLLMRERLPLGSMPMDHAPRLKKMTLYQIQKMGVGTITRLPLLDLRPVPGSAARLPLRSGFLRCHGKSSSWGSPRWDVDPPAIAGELLFHPEHAEATCAQIGNMRRSGAIRSGNEYSRR